VDVLQYAYHNLNSIQRDNMKSSDANGIQRTGHIRQGGGKLIKPFFKFGSFFFANNRIDRFNDPQPQV